MKLALQIAAGILIAAGVLWLGSIVVTAAAIQAVNDALPLHVVPASPQAPSQPANAMPSQAQMDRWNAETDAEEARERRQEARCTVRTADGRELHCDPLGPFTPR